MENSRTAKTFGRGYILSEAIEKGTYINTFKSILSLLISIVIIGSSYGVVLAGEAEVPDPAKLYEKECSRCHVIESSKSKKKSEKGWRKTVMRMKNTNGSTITDEEAEIIIRYLADKYGK